jgi:hypothetical protein
VRYLRKLGKGISHEAINTVLALLGFLLALVTAISEFTGPSDDFTATVTYLNLSRTVNSVDGGFPHWDSGRPTGVIQFAQFEVLMHNKSEENISITHLDQGIFTEKHGIIFDAALSAFVETTGSSTRIYSLPFTIPANEAVSVSIIATIPYDMDAASGNNCVVAGLSYGEINDCLGMIGRDLAGNQFEVIVEGRSERRLYTNKEKSLRIVFRFQAADGTSFDAPTTVIY